ncbi:MAG: alpha/beta hydrolase [Marmoricola sp.]
MTQSSTETTRTSQTRTLGGDPSAVHYYLAGDLHESTQDRPALLMIGSPMDATGFGSLANHFTDRPVVTYDPRGAGRNPTGTSALTPEQHADDLHRLIEELGVGPVDLFASSGGAVNALALVAAHRDDVRRLVAHEPPIAALLPDRDEVLAVCDDMRSTYERSGTGPAMAKFIAFVMVEGPLSADYLDQPAPDPAMFALSIEDDGSRADPLMRNIPGCTAYEPDLEALAVIADRLVLAVGVESGEQFAARAARSIAEALGLPATEFPSNHGGFLGGEFGQQGDPVAFAAALHAALG